MWDEIIAQRERKATVERLKDVERSSDTKNNSTVTMNWLVEAKKMTGKSHISWEDLAGFRCRFSLFCQPIDTSRDDIDHHLDNY